MAGNHVLLETIQLTQSTASITFNNIPQSGYTDLKIIMSARGNGTSFSTQPWQNCSITLNGQSNSAAKQLYATAAGVGTDSQGSGIWITDPEATANIFSNNEIYLPNYLSSSAKSISVDNATENNGTDAALVLWTALYSSVTTAVTSITITPVSGSFLAYSTFSLYAIADTSVTPEISPKATGGNIVANDGTYWYHAFTSSGTFIPQQQITADIVTLAGGGTGGRGGGGAGGLVYSSSQTLTSTTNYPCVIGAGGASRTSDYGQASPNGNNSQFASLTAATGGGGGAGYGVAGANGGCGGGAGWGSGTTHSGGSGSQGGNGSATNGNGPSGGGGGVGGSASSRQGANGTSTYSSWLSAVNLGQNSGGTYYIGGGGSGGGDNSGNTSTLAGGLGGGGTGSYGGYSTPANALAFTSGGFATGGGGGGGWYEQINGSYAGLGGSGIVIIRYAM